MFQPDNNDDDSSLMDNLGHSDNYDSGDNDRMQVLRDQDRFLPIANISRIMKRSIPSSGKIAKESKECAQECVSEFVSFITSEASDRCKQEKRKTINGEDILFAMATLGFDNYIEPLKLYLMKYREHTMRNDKFDFKSFEIRDDDGSSDSYSQIDNDSAHLFHES